MCIIHSPHLQERIPTTCFWLITEILTYYCVPLYGFICLFKINDFTPIYLTTLLSLTLLTFFGIENIIFGSSSFITSLGQIKSNIADLLELLDGRERLRVFAMFRYPFDYGYICCITSYILIYGNLSSCLSKKSLYYGMFCSLFGVFCCGCRTVPISFLLSISVFILLFFKLKRYFQIIITITITLVAIYNLIPSIQLYTYYLLSSFDSHSDVEGSSLLMRYIQYSAVLDHIQGKELFGCGERYFCLDLGWGDDGPKTLIDPRLYGLEGVIMSKLLERGFFGVIVYLLYYLGLFYFAIVHRKTDKLTSAIIISILVNYFLFSNMTGELSSAFPTLLVVGGFMSVLTSKLQDTTYNVFRITDSIS